MSRFELIVTVLNEQDVQARTLGGGDGSGKVKLEPLQRETISIFEDWLSRGKISQRKELEVLGKYLYKALFNGDVEKLFVESLNARKAQEAGNVEERLIIRLSFKEEAAKLKDLPWEYLYYPDTEYRRGFFLSTTVELVLSRYIPLERGSHEPEPEESPLRVLIVVSNPGDNTLGPVVSEKVIETIEKLAEQYPIKVDTLDKPTTDLFLKTLDDTKPHVLHFIGHGHYRKAEGRAEIALLQDDEKSVRWVRDSDFAEYFERISPMAIPRLVLLHLCESATMIDYETFTANFARLAPALMQGNIPIPAVVAMQYPLPNQAAVDFSQVFYRALAKGESIDTAVQDARWRITTNVSNAYNNRVFGTPVLYARSHGGIIWPPVKQTSLTQPKSIVDETAPPPQKVPRITGDNTTNQSAKLAQYEPVQTTGSLSSKQDVVSTVETRQAKAEVNIEPVKTDPNQVFRLNFVKTIISAGENKMAERSHLTANQRDQISLKLSTIRDQLVAVDNPDKMGDILRRVYSESEDRDLRAIIWSMIDALEQRL
jgi:hypothetical protein